MAKQHSNSTDPTTPSNGQLGFILDAYPQVNRHVTELHFVGKLETGETFRVVQHHEGPRLYVRATELIRARPILERHAVTPKPVELQTMDGGAIEVIEVTQTHKSRALAKDLESAGVRTYEADLNPALRFLMDRDIHCGVRIHGDALRPTDHRVKHLFVNPELTPAEWVPETVVLSFDIETNYEATAIFGFSMVTFRLRPQGPKADDEECLEEIHIVGEPRRGDPAHLHSHESEIDLLRAFGQRIREIDPDILTGWNIVDFDLPVLSELFEKCRLPFELGRAPGRSEYFKGSRWGGSRVTIRGRPVLDALHLMRGTMRRFEDFRLDTVARSILGRGKILEVEEGENAPAAIERAYREDRMAFCAYCLEDARLVRDIALAEGLIELTMNRSRLIGLPLERAWGSVAAFDFLYIGELHRKGMVAPTLGVDRTESGGAPGGLVMSARAGLYRNVWVLDFKSLYPSIMRTFNIDPLAHLQADSTVTTEDPIVAPNGARFDRAPGILPSMLDRFFKERDLAKAQGHKLASYVYKIIMNSFYGVLASPGCRFSSVELAGAITEFGHYFLRWTRSFLEEQGYQVLYGDTDSVFVESKLPDDVSTSVALTKGQELQDQINVAISAHIRNEHGVSSRLDLEFDKFYRRFFLPAGAKRYAGLLAEPDGERLEIVGLEAVRRDWTDLAQQLQRELLEMIFRDCGVEHIEAHIRQKVHAVRNGDLDEQLVYRKGLRKPVSEYTRITPPHVKAARLLPHPSGVIRYYMTKHGPQPLGHVSSPIDYGHYVNKQIQPIVRMFSEFTEIDFTRAVEGKSLFDFME